MGGGSILLPARPLVAKWEICCLLLTVPLQPVLRGGGQAGELLVVDAHLGHTAGQSHDLCKDLN